MSTRSMNTNIFILRLLFALVGYTTVFGGLLLLPAETLDWRRAWVFLGVIAVGVIVTMVDVFRENEALWNERLKPQTFVIGCCRTSGNSETQMYRGYNLFYRDCDLHKPHAPIYPSTRSLPN